jgi:glutamate--cysteine ligase
MSDIGYQNNKELEKGFKASYDSLAAYVDTLSYAISTPCPQYEKIGIVVDGEYRQLNVNILQIENEYYSTIRPKQVLNGMEKPTLALKNRGVQYVELRSLDINPFNPLGIELEQLLFLETFLIFCLLHDSPLLTRQEQREIDANQLAAANSGRDPDLHLQRRGNAVPLRQWAQELCEMMGGLAETLDAAHGDRRYSAALQQQQRVIGDPTLTPSARVLEEMRRNQESFFDFALRHSREHQAYFKTLNLPAKRATELHEAAQQSLQEQAAIEASDDLSFSDYLQRYFAQQ